MTSVRLGKELESRLNELAEATARSKSFYIKEAIQGYLDEYEDLLMALNIKERLQKGLEKTYTLEEVQKQLGLNKE